MKIRKTSDLANKSDHDVTLLTRICIYTAGGCACAGILVKKYAYLSISAEKNLVTFFGVLSSIAAITIFLDFVKKSNFTRKQIVATYSYIICFSIIYTLTQCIMHEFLSLTSLLYNTNFILCVYVFAIILSYSIVTTAISAGIIFVALLVPCFYLFYYSYYGVAPYINVFQHIMQSNLMQSIEFVHTTEFALYGIALIGTISIAVCLLIRKYASPSRTTMIRYLIALIILMSANVVVGTPPMFYYIYLAHKQYVQEVDKFKAEAEKRRVDIKKLVAEKKGEGETYVIAIGESLSKKHMSIYNYVRQTTPRLQQEKELLIFKKVFSNFPKTRIILPMALSASNLYNGEIGHYRSFSILDVLQRSGMKTFWLTNHSLYSFWDNPITIFAKGAQYLRGFNSLVGIDNSHNFDHIMLPHVEKILRGGGEENKVIFVHLYGNHKDYCKRFPANYQKFYGELPIHMFGGLHGSKFTNKINCYDNSVLYQDTIMSNILRLTKETVGDRVSGFIFFPDNGVDVMRGLGQNEDVFTHDMVDIPMLAWFSDSYRREYPQRFNTFSMNTSKIFSLDLIYDTLIGLLDIQTDEYNSSFDLSSSNYSLTNPMMLGNKVYFDRQDENYWQQKKVSYFKENKNYWQRHNIEQLTNKEENVVVPRSVNSIGKLKEIWSDGHRAFETHLLYSNSKSCLLISSNVNSITDLCLKDFLSHIDTKKVKKILLDIKNLSRTNVHEVITQLNHIHEVTGLKEQYLVEVQAQDESFKKIVSQGFKACLMLDFTATKVEREKSQQIAKYIENNNVKHLCFDESMYPFVEKNLKELIDSDVSYNIISNSNLSDESFLQNQKEKEYYKQTRVKTVLVDYESIFNF